jgi:hypothetical protein
VNPFRVGDKVIHKTGGYVCRVIWCSMLECKVRWSAAKPAFWLFGNWHDRQKGESWNYIPFRDLRLVE